ncbi:MAG: hypothetical protein KF691_16065 [Phycisphaeraceae bacterium]|nr:hypothetical protein [Phycisphaeraceae bacterium]
MPSKLAFVSPLALVLCAGSCLGQVVTWDGAAGPNWFDFFQSGNCPNTQLQYFNGFGQVGCGGPIFPGGSNFVVVNIAAGPNINGDVTVSGISNGGSSTTTWSGGNVNFGNGVGQGLSNSGTFLLNPGGDRSVFSSVIDNTGTFEHAYPGTLYFQTLAFNNTGLTTWHGGTWLNYTGTNSVSNSGEIDKVSADPFTNTVAMQQNGVLDVQAGTLNLQSNNFTFGNASSTIVRTGATLSLQSLSSSGKLNGSVVNTGVLRLSGDLAQSGNLTTNVFGGNGFSWVSGNWNAAGNTLTNTGLFTLSSPGDCSFYSGTLVNSNAFVATAPSTLYFQTLAFVNNSNLQLYRGSWVNYTGTNSLTNNGTMTKFGPDTFYTSVPATLAGTVAINQGAVQFNGTTVNFQNPTTTLGAGTLLSFSNSTIQGTFGPSLGSGAAVEMVTNTYQSGNLTVNASGSTGFSWPSGDWQSNGFVLTNQGLFSILQIGDRSLYFSTFNNSGTLLYNTQSILYFQTAAYSNTGTTEWRNGTWYNYTGTNSLASSGTLKKTTADQFNLNVPSTISGPLQVQAGTLRCFGAPLNFTPSSSVTVSSGATLAIENCTLQGKLSASASGGSAVMYGGTFLSAPFTSNVSGAPGLNYAGGELSLNANTFTNTNLFTLSADTDRSIYAGAFANFGTFDASSAGTLYFQTLAFSNSGTLRLHKGTWHNYTGTNSLANSGTMEKIDATSWTCSVPFAQSGVFHVKAGSATFQNATIMPSGASFTDTLFGSSLVFNSCSFKGNFPGASGGPGSIAMNTFGLSDDFTSNIAGDGFLWASGEGSFNDRTLTNAGIFSIASGDRSAYSGTLLNSGTLNLAVSTFYFQAFTLNNQGAANWSSGTFVNYTGSNSIINTGTFAKTGPATVSSSVPIANSGVFALDAGVANVSTFTQNPGATIRTTISSASDAGRLNISTPVALQGNLAVYFDPFFAPSVGQSWTVLTSPTLNGTFTNIVPVAFPAGRQIAVTYVPIGAPTQVVITVLASGCVADFNHDGVVDDADFVIFVPAYNILDCNDPSMPAGCPADLNGDGFVDDTDFQLFVYAYDILLCPE